MWRSSLVYGTTVTTFSYPTEAVVIDALEHWTHRSITVLMREVDLADLDPGQGSEKRPNNKIKRLEAVFEGVRDRAEGRNARRLQQLVLSLANTAASDPDHPPTWLATLEERLRVDGYELRQAVSGPGWKVTATYQLLPAGAAPAPIEPDLTALEAELEANGYSVALRHYTQAVRSYVAGELEAANGQLRSFLEDLFVELASARWLPR